MQTLFGVVAVLISSVEAGKLSLVIPGELDGHLVERLLGLPAAGGNEDDD